MSQGKTSAGKTDVNNKEVPSQSSQRDKLDKRLAELRSQALSLEEKALYAEKEAQLRKRIRDAEDRIRASQPQSAFDFPSLGGLWKRIPTPLKLLLVVGTLVVLLLVIGKACAGGG